MKIISFNVVQILPALLKGTKDQTIRPAWNIKEIKFKIELNKDDSKKSIPIFTEKPFRFKEGDEAQLMWKCRSSYQLFCKKCGGGIRTIFGKDFEHKCNQGRFIREDEVFNKKIREVIITGVFKIIMWKEKNKFFVEFNDEVIREFNNAIIQIPPMISELSRRDGFLHPIQMFQTLDRMYDLSKEKSFWVIRWRKKWYI